MPPPSSCRQSTRASAPVHANHDIHLAVERGTIHGIVGENGAGKSTLMSILYGFYQADAGEILVNGEPTRSATARPRSPPASAWSTSTSCWSSPSPCSRTSCSAPRAARCSARAWRSARASCERLERDYDLEVDPGRGRRRALGRQPAARRDPQGALPRRRHPDPRRADRRADAGRGRPPLPHPASAARRRARRSSSSPTSCARSWPSPTRSP